MQGIYQIKSKQNNRVYVGSSKNIRTRWRDHRSALRKNRHGNQPLQNAWNKYGEESFQLEILEIVEGEREILWEREKYWLDIQTKMVNVYNVAEQIGGGNLGPEVIQKIRQSSIQYWQTHDGYWKGRKRTEENIQKSRKGLLLYYETHDVWNKGKKLGPQTEEHKRKNSEANMGRIIPEETRRKTSATLMGHPVSDETRQKLSIALSGENHPNYGKHRSKETCAKIGDANASQYPAFYNTKTKQFIPAGRNLSKLFREHGLTYYAAQQLMTGRIKHTKNGWYLLAAGTIEEEIAQLLDKF